MSCTRRLRGKDWHMRPTTSRISKTLVAMCAATAVVAPAANAVDLRSPDGAEGAVMVAPSPSQDLRSPDASDTVANASGSHTPAPSDSSGGNSWDTVGIVGGSVLAVALVGFGLVALNRRRHGLQKSRIPAISS